MTSAARQRTLAAQGKTAQRTIRFEVTVNGTPYAVDVNRLTLREKAAISAELRKLKLDPTDPELMNAGAIWSFVRRDDPTLTLDDVLDGVSLGDMAAIDDGEVDEDPEV